MASNKTGEPAPEIQPAEARGLIAFIGVSGSGKSTLGAKTAAMLGIDFIDADDLHSAANIRKMASGRPLNDTDRQPWLVRINETCRQAIHKRGAVVLAAAGHKEAYRTEMSQGLGPVTWFYLEGPAALILDRMQGRQSHYMPPSLLESQLAIMEPPENGYRLDITHPPEQLLPEILEIIKKPGPQNGAPAQS